MNHHNASHGGLDDRPFSYRQGKDGMVFISWWGRQVTSLKGPRAEKFLRRIAGVDIDQQQLEMARITGNFKRGNEKG